MSDYWSIKKMLIAIKKNFIFLLLAFALVSSAIVYIPNREFIYYGSILYLICFSFKNNCSNIKKRGLFLLFITACVMSSITNWIFDIRLLAFIVVLMASTPILMSKEIFIFREKYIYYCLMIFPLLSIAAIYCYFFGINAFENTTKSIHGYFLDFSAFFPHPMWLAAAVGLANVVFLWLVLNTKNYIIKYLLISLLLLSVYLSVAAASRSALVASLLAMIFLLILKLHNWKKIVLASSLIYILAITLIPVYSTASQRMADKFNNKNVGKYGSRTDVVINGFDHLTDNVFFGAGFAVSYNAEGYKIKGKMESGSGWLSILFQTGIFGFTIMCTILIGLRKIVLLLYKDDKLQLFMCSFLFLCFHSLFEGYILTVGYYPCILFWNLLGYLYIYPYTSRNHKMVCNSNL